MNIIENGNYTVFSGELKKEHFEKSPVWCEYYAPDELDDISELDRKWLSKTIEDYSIRYGSAPYYSIERYNNFSNKEFLCAACDFYVQGKQLFGYTFINRGEVRSVTIFVNNSIIDFFSSDLLDEDNQQSKLELLSYIGKETQIENTIDYELGSNFEVGIPPKGKFVFPT